MPRVLGLPRLVSVDHKQQSPTTSHAKSWTTASINQEGAYPTCIFWVWIVNIWTVSTVMRYDRACTWTLYCVTKIKMQCLSILRYCVTRQWCRLRPLVFQQDRSETKKSVLVLVLYAVVLVSVLQVWCCVVKHRLVTLVVIMILNDIATFQVLFVSLFRAWNITTVEINSGVYLKVKFVECLCLLPLSWSCYFGLGLGLVSSGLGLGLENLVLFTSLSQGNVRT